MTLTGRDRKIVFLLVPIAVILGYWFLVLAPKRQEESKVKNELTQAQAARDTAQQAASQLGGAKRNFAADYATVIYLGKSIPSSVDMPSLMVQLDRASRGTGIDFAEVKTGTRAAPGTGSASSGGSGSSGSSGSGSGSSSPGSTAPNGGSGPANSSTPAQSGAGQAAQSAGGAVNQSNASSTAAGLPAGGSSTSGSGGGGGGQNAAGLDSVPLDFTFKGSFTHLADFFHRMKRFVRVANRQIVVRGRLIVINSFSFDDQDVPFPMINAKVHATVYLAPKAEGVSAGASPQGPAGAGPSSQQASTGSSSIPAATVSAP